jgi:4'-phosphopantetheinyl transferase
MPLSEYIVVSEHARLGVWHITEDEDFFIKKLPLKENELAELVLLRGHRRLEWLAARYLLQVMTGWVYTMVKDSHGKPHLHNKAYEISVSHSKDYTAIIIAPDLVGVDIQYLTPKLVKVAYRVLNEQKFEQLKEETKLEHLHVYWGAKEALYKAYGKKNLDFRKNIQIEPFHYGHTEGVLKGTVITHDYIKHFIIFYKKIENYLLVYAIENKEQEQKNAIHTE